MSYKFIFILLLSFASGELILLKNDTDLYCISSDGGQIESPWTLLERNFSNTGYRAFVLKNITENGTCTDLKTNDSNYMRENINNIDFVFGCEKRDYFGRNCDLNCSVVTNSSSCSKVQVCNSTHCSCLPGYYGSSCESRCARKKYGVNCNGNCSEHCKNEYKCNIVNGTCIRGCNEGWERPKCTEQVAITTPTTTSTVTTTAHTTSEIITQKPTNKPVIGGESVATTKQQNVMPSQPPQLLTNQPTIVEQPTTVLTSTQSTTVSANGKTVSENKSAVTTTISTQSTRVTSEKGTENKVGTGSMTISTQSTMEKMTLNGKTDKDGAGSPTISTQSTKVTSEKGKENQSSVSTTISTPSTLVIVTPIDKNEKGTVSTTISTPSTVVIVTPIDKNEKGTVSTTISTPSTVVIVTPIDENKNGAVSTTISTSITVVNPNSTIDVEKTAEFTKSTVENLGPGNEANTTTTQSNVITKETTTSISTIISSTLTESTTRPTTTEHVHIPVTISTASPEPISTEITEPTTEIPTVTPTQGGSEPESSTEVQQRTTKDSTKNNGQNKNKQAGILNETTILIIFSVLLTFLVIMILGCLISGAKRRFVMKHLHRLRMASQNGRQELFPMYARDVELENQDGDLQYFLPNTAAPVIAGAEIVALSPIPSHSLSVAVSELRAYVEHAVTSGVLRQQHALFPRGQTQPWEEGQKAEHRGKNRYLKLYAYDHTRVQLIPLKNDPNSHYINANFIDGYEKQKQYIATQGPNKMTISDFWRMVWQEDVTTIVMLANVIEDNKPKCEQYWPDVCKEIQYGSINIRNKEEKVFLDYTIRNFLVTNKTGMGEITRKVRHLHYTVWPDHGVVQYPHSLAQFIRCMMDDGKPPYVVHCSAGVGRTGTVILSHACYQMAQRENRVDCLALVGKIRSQRANLVDREEQYELVHRLLIELLVVGDTRIPKEGFQTQLAERMEYGNEFMNQFQLINAMSENEAEKIETVSWPIEKSRFPAIVPGERGRVTLDQNATFINAVTVDGLKIKDEFIVTQLPLPETLDDFWSMVVQHQASVIVLLNEPQPSFDTSTTLLWNEHPEMTMQLEAANVTAKHCNLRSYGDLTEIQLEYTELDAAGERRTVGREVCVVRLKGWQNGVLMHGAPEDWVNIWRDVELNKRNNLPVVIACHDGATASGFFVAACYVFQSIDETGMVDVASAVRNVRHNRPQFIAKYEQFEFLYEIASEYINTYEIYENSDVILRNNQIL